MGRTYCGLRFSFFALLSFALVWPAIRTIVPTIDTPVDLCVESTRALGDELSVTRNPNSLL